jgi:hypothetical protein
MLRGALQRGADALCSAPPGREAAAARRLDAACRTAFGCSWDAADVVLSSESRRGERLALAHALRGVVTPVALAALLRGPPRAQRLGAALLVTWEANVDSADRMTLDDADAAAAAAAAGDALHACGAVTAALLDAALAAAPGAETPRCLAEEGVPDDDAEAAAAEASEVEPPRPLAAARLLDDLLRACAAAMRDSGAVAAHLRASRHAPAFLALLARWFAEPPPVEKEDAATALSGGVGGARALRTASACVLQTLSASAHGVAALAAAAAPRDAVVAAAAATLAAAAAAATAAATATRTPTQRHALAGASSGGADGYSPAEVGGAAALVCNCVHAHSGADDEDDADASEEKAPTEAAAAADATAAADDADDDPSTLFAALFCAAGVPASLRALLSWRSALLRPRPDDAAALAVTCDAVARLAVHAAPRAALLGCGDAETASASQAADADADADAGAGAGVALSEACVLVTTLVAAARFHPVHMAAEQAGDTLRALLGAARDDPACAPALRGVLVPREPDDDLSIAVAPPPAADADADADADAAPPPLAPVQLSARVLGGAAALCRACGWDAWAPGGAEEGGAPEYYPTGAAAAALMGSGGYGDASSAADGSCAACGAAPPRAGPPFQTCAACKRVAYCGKACQAGAWSGHKRECKRAVAADADARAAAADVAAAKAAAKGAGGKGGGKKGKA